MKKNILKKITLLYVDDDAFIRENAIEYLSRYFNKVLEASDGLKALDVIKKNKIDIIITDIKMPHLNGLDFAKKVRESDKKTQIIITTAFTNTEYLIQAVELQLVKYMVKPILESKLLPVLYSCVQSIIDDNSNIKHFSLTHTFDTFNKTLLNDNKIIKLRKNELLLLELLCQNINRTVTYSEIEHYIWHNCSMTGDAIRSLVTALRKKLPNNTIENLSGIGYKINLLN